MIFDAIAAFFPVIGFSLPAATLRSQLQGYFAAIRKYPEKSAQSSIAAAMRFGFIDYCNGYFVRIR